MDRIANIINNRLSLRKPQSESLKILSELVSELDLTGKSSPESQLNLVNAKYPTCSDFEREFTSM